MRIIAGRCRGMRIEVPRGKQTRPMPDRMRESLFSSLGSEYGTPGELPDLHVLDLFAGTGSFGLEALSRGAKLCCFVEKARSALSALRQNIERLGLQGQCWIINGDAFTCDLPEAPEKHRWQLVFADPPYVMSQVHVDLYSIPNLLAGLSESGLLADQALVILRHPVKTDFDRPVARLRPERTRTYGTMTFTWFRYGSPMT